MGTIEHLRRELPRLRPLTDQPMNPAFANSARNLGAAVLMSMKATENVVRKSFGNSSLRHRICLQHEQEAILDARKILMETTKVAQATLQTITNDVDLEQRTSGGEVGFPPHMFDMCLFMITLLQVRL